MATIALPIESIERRMRGGAQALLVRDGAGNAYVAKCVGNPQGTRTLINEWIVTRLLKYLRVSTPEVHALLIDRGVPGDHLMEFQVGNRRIPIQPGIHLGSRCPVDPERKAIFDFLPRRLLHAVRNLPDLVMAFAFDKWVNQTDTRQAIFIRERSTEPTAKFRAYLIDHGLSFGGSRWELSEGTLSGLYHDRSIYDNPSKETDCHAAVDRIQRMPENSVFSIEKEIPAEWLQPGDREDMTRLLELLCDRRTKLHDTIDRALHQLGEAGMVIPKASGARRLLSALLLLACLPGSLTPNRTGIEIELIPSPNREPLQALEHDEPPHTSNFDFNARSPQGTVIRQYGIQISRRKAVNTAPQSWTETASAQEDIYFLRIFAPQNEANQSRLLGEYALLLEK